MRKMLMVLFVMMMFSMLAMPAFAQTGGAAAGGTNWVAITAGFAIAIAAGCARIRNVNFKTGGLQALAIKRQHLFEIVSYAKAEAVAQLIAALLGPDILNRRARVRRHPGGIRFDSRNTEELRKCHTTKIEEIA
jgi:hypothetical protein